MDQHTQYMKRCIELAQLGAGKVAPNPMVGAVITHQGKIIGEGFHQKYGENHAEVNAITSVEDKSLLKHATIYVSLEPCAHFGKTPPCANLIVKHKIPKVVIGTVDPFAKVAGKGIDILAKAGCEVKTGVLEEECRLLNRRFFTFHQKKRPFIILKWAQSIDGFIDKIRSDVFTSPAPISGRHVKTWVHRERTKEDAILIGKNTAILDNPQLSSRKYAGSQPLRIALNKKHKIPLSNHLYDQSIPTAIFVEQGTKRHPSEVELNFELDTINQILEYCHQNQILSLVVEGGTNLLNQFIERKLWDETWKIVSNQSLGSGVKAPNFGHQLTAFSFYHDTINFHSNA